MADELKSCVPVACPSFTEETLTVTHIYERCEPCDGTGRNGETTYRGTVAYHACEYCNGYGAIAIPVNGE